MSGGFFRGTSADQDTRFSNKEAKLLKSKKFAPELEILVDMTKVKMDVMRPWIAQRVTEMLGFEDEVLINFIFGLLDGKDVDGKQIQIQLTGFMEKNTGKFMKELWSLLISAQNNISGVPQQFLDAKEEETRKKKAETDRINWEIQQKREKDSREMVQEHKKKLDGATHSPQDAVLAPDASSKDLLSKTRTGDNNIDKHKLQERERFATPPNVDEQSHSPHRNYRNSPRRRSRSLSKTRSSSSENNRSRSISRSPERRRQPPLGRRSYSPVQSPDHKRSRYGQSPLRRRSPYLRRRTPSPIRRRRSTPVRRRSPSPWHRKSPAVVRKGSPSPRRRSPSPIRRRPSPVRQRSPSPRRRSPSPYRRRSPRYHRRSPIRSPRRHRAEVSAYERNRGRSPYRSHSPPKREHRSLSEGPGSRAHGSDLRHHDEGKNHRTSSKRSPDRYAPNKDDSEYSGGRSNAPESSVRPPSTTLRSPQRDVKHKPDGSHKMLKSTHYEEPLRGQSESPVHVQNRNLNEERGKNSSGRTDDLKKPSKFSPKVHGRNGHLRKNDDREFSPAAIASNTSPGHEYISEPIKNDDNLRSIDAYPLEEYPKKQTQLSSRNSEEIEYGPGRPEDDASQDRRTVRHAPSRRHSNDDDDEGRFAAADMVSRKSRLDEKMKLGYEDRELGNKKEDESDGEGEENKNARYYKDHKKQKREESERGDGDDDHDISGSDERKESKRRRKEEKKKRKEERRRKREERHQRREERREMKAKSVVSGSSDYGKNHNVVDRSDGDDARGSSYQSDADEEESEQKRLEIELRKKALESLRAKKAIY